MFTTFQNNVFRKAEIITKQYKNCLIIFASSGFLETCGRKMAVAPSREYRLGFCLIELVSIWISSENYLPTYSNILKGNQ